MKRLGLMFMTLLMFASVGLSYEDGYFNNIFVKGNAYLSGTIQEIFANWSITSDGVMTTKSLAVENLAVDVSAIDSLYVDSLLTVGRDILIGRDAIIDGELSVADTLAVGLLTPEYLFHVFNAGVYNLFEGNNDGKTYVAVDNNHATHECGFSIWRLGVEKWTFEDSNGTFIIYDSDDTANRVTIDGTTGNVTVYQNLNAASDLAVGDSLSVTGNATFATDTYVAHDSHVGGDVFADTYNFATSAMVAGTANAITIDFTPDLPAVGAGSRVSFIAEGLNTGATTLNIDEVGAINVFENTDVSACEGGEIVDGMAVELMHDGTQWQIISNQP